MPLPPRFTPIGERGGGGTGAGLRTSSPGDFAEMGILEEGVWGRDLIRTEWVGRGRGWRNPDPGGRTVPAENSEGREHRFRSKGAILALSAPDRADPEAESGCAGSLRRPSRRFQPFRCPPHSHTTHLSCSGALRPHPWAPKPGHPGPRP